jgi:hypothetical protein
MPNTKTRKCTAVDTICISCAAQYCSHYPVVDAARAGTNAAEPSLLSRCPARRRPRTHARAGLLTSANHVASCANWKAPGTSVQACERTSNAVPEL